MFVYGLRLRPVDGTIARPFQLAIRSSLLSRSSSLVALSSFLPDTQSRAVALPLGKLPSVCLPACLTVSRPAALSQTRKVTTDSHTTWYAAGRPVKRRRQPWRVSVGQVVRTGTGVSLSLTQALDGSNTLLGLPARGHSWCSERRLGREGEVALVGWWTGTDSVSKSRDRHRG